MKKRFLFFIIIALLLGAAGILQGTVYQAAVADDFIPVDPNFTPGVLNPNMLELLTGFRITTGALPPGTLGTAYSAQLQATEGVEPYRWEVQGGSLPPGLSLNMNTGIISGIPGAEGIWSFTIIVYDNGVDRLKRTKDFVITVTQPGAPPPAITPFDFSLSIDDADLFLDIAPLTLGQQSVFVKTRIDVAQTSGNTSPTVSLSVSGDLFGAVATLLDPVQGQGSFSSYLTLTSELANSIAGDFQGVITATGGGVTRSQNFTLHKTNNIGAGDLKLNSVRAIQVVDKYGAYLTVGKNTIFKANISSTFNTAMTAKVELLLPAADWTWQGHSAGPGTTVAIPSSTAAVSSGFLDVPSYISYVTDVVVPAGKTVDVLLPDPYSLPSSTVQGYQVLGAPRPTHEGWSVFEARIDADQKIAESDEKNNASVEIQQDSTLPTYGLPRQKTIPTRELNILYMLSLEDQGEMNSYYPGGWGGTALNKAYTDEKRLAEQSAAHILGTYPIADQGKLRYDAPASVLLYNPAPIHDLWGSNMLWNMTGYLDILAKSWGYDRFVAVVPKDWLQAKGQDDAVGVTFAPCKSVFVDIDSVDKNPYTVTHELMHTLNHGDIYGDYPVMADDGYWVNMRKEIDGSSIRDYMDYAYDSIPAWHSIPQWINEDRYHYIINHLPPSQDPKVLIFGAILGKDNSVQLLPFQVVDGVVDPSDEDWNYSVVALGAGGGVLAKNNLNIQFTMYVDPKGAVPVDKSPVVTSLAWVDGTKAIELRDKDGHTLARQDVSANPPQVRLTSPQGGETYQAGRRYPVTWEASDQDGDKLYFSLAVSQDKKTWTPVAMDVEGSRFDLDPGMFQPGSYYLKIRATDGVNTAEDVSASFKIEGTGLAPAAVSTHVAEFYIGRQYYKVDQQSFDMDIAPYIKDDRTFLPVRFVAYGCGVEESDVSWDDATKTVQLQKGGARLTLRIGSQLLEVREASGAVRQVQMDVAPEITSSRTMLPVRWVAEQLGYRVSWEPSTATVRLESAE